MCIFETMREKSPLLTRAVAFFNSPLYPALFAAVCALSGVSGKAVYLPAIALLTLISIIAGLFSSDLKVFLVPAFLIYYAIGMDVAEDHYTHYDVTTTFDMRSVPFLLVCLTLLAATLVYKLIVSGAFREMLQKRGICFMGVLFIDIALLTNGIFGGAWQPINLAYGALSALVLTVGYCMFLSMFSHSENAPDFACHTLVSASLAISCEILIIAFRLHRNEMLYFEKIISHEVTKLILNRTLLSLSWGLPTIVGAVIALGIPAALYLARKGKAPVFHYLAAPFFFAMTVFIDTRSAILCGGIALVCGAIFCCVRNPRQKLFRRITFLLLFSLAVCLGATVIAFPDKVKEYLPKIIEMLRFDFETEGETTLSTILGTRAEYWTRGIRDFLSAPLFGVGFMSGNSLITDVYYKMYHNIVIEFLGSMGTVGIFAFLVHIKQLLEIAIRRFSVKKLLLLFVPCLILAMSLFDNFFFYPNFALLYTAFLAACEIALEEARREKLAKLNRPKKGEKPRVVFTFIEAGKGHIVPTRTVCNAFKAKYGDRVEVVESQFFTETGDPDMEKTEILFTRTVKNQNRTPIVSALCKIGNLLAGDTFALEFLLSKTVSGRKTAPLAIRNMEELNAHLVYSAHWATPYYVNKMTAPRPYTVTFCPDVYSNGAFNVDSNEFLMASDVGADKVERVRMYAGGKITRIPFPSRPEIALLKKNGIKESLRQTLGLPRDTFTVSLSDGGYGMARLGNTVRQLLRVADVPITVIALCGTNDTLYRELSTLKEEVPNPNVTLIPLSFTDRITEYIAASDLYVGKSGANSIAEPASLGVPIIVTKCITYIERGIKNYYVRNLKGAIYLPSAKRAARRIVTFAQNPSLLAPYRENLENTPQDRYNAEASADLLFARLVSLGYVADKENFKENSEFPVTH